MEFHHNNEIKILNNPELAASEYSEGDALLEELLLTCYKQDLMTEGCCKGHNDGKLPYLSIIYTDKNEEKLQRLSTNLSNHKQFNVGFSNGNVIRDRLVFFIRSTGTDVNWKIATDNIEALVENDEKPPIGEACKIAAGIVRKHFSFSQSMAYTELSQNGNLYIYFPETALVDELLFVRKVPLKRFENEDVMGKKFIPWGFILNSGELESPEENENKKQAREILDVLDNAKEIMLKGPHLK